MKTKLLRKVRKRYSIVYEENSTYFRDVCYGLWNVMFLRDSTEHYRYKAVFIGKAPLSGDTVFPTKEEAFKYLHKCLWGWIERDYAHLGKRRNKYHLNKTEKLWYNDGNKNNTSSNNNNHRRFDLGK